MARGITGHSIRGSGRCEKKACPLDRRFLPTAPGLRDSSCGGAGKLEGLLHLEMPTKLRWSSTSVAGASPGDALLETIGRRTGRGRLTLVCDYLDGDTFWIVGQLGRSAGYARDSACIC